MAADSDDRRRSWRATAAERAPRAAVPLRQEPSEADANVTVRRVPLAVTNDSDVRD